MEKPPDENDTATSGLMPVVPPTEVTLEGVKNQTVTLMKMGDSLGTCARKDGPEWFTIARLVLLIARDSSVAR